jgi:uncharacterized protein involved in outer membrane biogenesis
VYFVYFVVIPILAYGAEYRYRSRLFSRQEREMKKKTLKNVIIVVVGFVAVVLVARNVLIKTATRKAIQAATGFDIELGRVHVGLFSPTFEITELKLINPEDFPEREALEIKTLRVRYDVPSLFTDTVHLPEVLIDIPKMTVLTKEDGESNLQRLGKKKEKAVEPPAAGEGEVAKAEPPAEEVAAKAEKPQKEMRIDKLTIKLGTATVHRYVAGQDKPETINAPMNVDRTFNNVTNLDQVVTVLSADILVGALPNALNDINAILQSHEGDPKAAEKELSDKVKQLKESYKDLFKK